MSLADKITDLRKKRSWSQEELAEKMQVSRQAVSKWEAAGAVPELDKIVMMSELFGVTTDYLLKDNTEDEGPTGQEYAPPAKRVTLATATAFLTWKKSASVRIAVGVFLCILAVIPLLLLGAAAETQAFPISEPVAAGAGLSALLFLVAIAVVLFLSCQFGGAPFAFLENEPFETEPNVTGMVREQQKAYRNTYVGCNVAGTCLCVLSPIPLFIGAFTDNDFWIVAALSLTLFLAGIGAVCFVLAGVRWGGMQRLLKEGEFSPKEKQKNRVRETIASVYWLTVVAIYLGWSVLFDGWGISWVVFPVAGVLFAALMCILTLLTDRKNK